MSEQHEENNSDICPLVGKWGLDRQECFEEFLAENGANWFVRKMAQMASPELTVEKDGDTFHIQMKSTMMTKKWDVTLGQEIEDKAMSGDIFLVVARMEGEKLVMEMKPKEEGKGKAQTHSRYVENGEMILELEVGNVKAKRIFKKIE